MEMIVVESSNIDSIGWETNELFVKFKTGKTYKYENVEREKFLEMLGSKSRGQYLNQQIKPNYQCKLID